MNGLIALVYILILLGLGWLAFSSTGQLLVEGFNQLYYLLVMLSCVVAIVIFTFRAISKAIVKSALNNKEIRQTLLTALHDQERKNPRV